MIIRPLVPLVLLFPCLVHAASTQDISLCHADEQVVFSCLVHRTAYAEATSNGKYRYIEPYQWLKTKKIISLCATNPITPESGHLWYRFGVPNQTPEFTYPKSDSASSAEFTVKSESWAKGYVRSISFKSDDLQYQVYSHYSVFEVNYRSNGGGVVITQPNKLVTDYWCDGSAIKKTKSFRDHSYELLVNPSGTDFDDKTISYK